MIGAFRDVEPGQAHLNSRIAAAQQSGSLLVSQESDDWLLNRLEVSGPQEPLLDFLQTAAGPGFIDWRPDWHLLLEHLEAGLARRLRDRFWNIHERARSAAEQNAYGVPLDLNTLLPVPKTVLRQGYYPAGRLWCWENWGTEAPLRKVTFRMEMRRCGERRIEQVAVFEFLSLDWSPSRALLSMRERWSTLRFALRPIYNDWTFPAPAAQQRAA